MLTYVGTVIFNSSISAKLGSGITNAAISLKLPVYELAQFIGALASKNQAALIQVQGVTPQIIGADVRPLQVAYLVSFRSV